MSTEPEALVSRDEAIRELNRMAGEKGTAEARVRELEARLAMAEAAAGEAGKLVAQFRSQRDELRGATPDLRQEIKTMLDNTILDWNRPRQLTTVNAKQNYDKLIPAIERLVRRIVASRIEAERAALLPAPTDEDKPNEEGS